MHIFADKMHQNKNFNKICKFYISKVEVREIVQNVHVCKAPTHFFADGNYS